MCLVVNTMLYAFVCRHMVHHFIGVGGFQDLELFVRLIRRTACARAGGRIDGETYMTKLIAFFAILLNAKNEESCHRK